MLAAAAPAAEPPAEQLPAASLYLQAVVNGRDSGLIVEIDARGDSYSISADDLSAIGLVVNDLAPDADGRLPLDAIPGLRYRYDSAAQTLDIDAADSRRVAQLLGYVLPSETEPSSNVGVVLNYALSLQSEDTNPAAYDTRLLAPQIASGFHLMPVVRSSEFERSVAKSSTVALDTDLRVFSPVGLFVDHGYTTRAPDDPADYVRYDTYWRRTSVDSMRTWVAGDFISASLPWTRALRLGGVRVGRNFEVRPDLVTFPIPAFGGTAVVPTTVDLYVNGQRQFAGDAQPGPFRITEPPALTGAGLVSIVYRDASGREVRTTQPLYVDVRLLEQGLSDYAFEVGYPRHNYGAISNEYGDDPAATASWRYGLSDRFTLEAHAEGTKGLRNGGVGGLLAVGRRTGVLTGSVAASDAAGHGYSTSFGYQYVAPQWSMDLYQQRTHGDYADLGTVDGVPVAERLNRASVSWWFAATHSLNASYAEQQSPELGGSRVVSLGYNGSWLGSRLSTFVNLFSDKDQADSDGFYVALTWSFGGGAASVYSGASRYGNEHTQILGADRPVDYDRGGLGWGGQTERGNDGYQRDTLRFDYRMRYGDWSAGVEKLSPAGGDDKTNTLVYGSGSLVYMNRAFLAARAIYDGFALVSTQGTPDVPVLRENRLLGATNRRGYLLVDDLPSYRTSRLAIDTLNLPLDVSVVTDRLQANPRERSGVLVEFPLERFRGATLVVVDEDENFLPPGTRIDLLDTEETALIGYDGQVFFPTLAESNRFAADTDAGRCEFEVRFAQEQAMQTLGPFVCVVKQR